MSSAHYVELVGDEEVRAAVSELGDAWKSPDIPMRQRELVDRELAAYRTGTDIAPFRAYTELVRLAGTTRILDVGCASGYYAELLEIFGWSGDYVGADFSAAFIALAKTLYPPAALRGVNASFVVADARALPFGDAAFDMVVSGCCMLHISDWGACISESARVSSRWVILHRTPVRTEHPTTYYRKEAYGVPCIEIHLNERDLLSRAREAGLEVVLTHDLSGTGDYWNRSYLCRKVAT